MYNRLGPRIYEILKPNENPKPLPRDHDQWLMCSHPRKGCGRIYRRQGVKVESDITDVVEKTDEYDNPTIVGLDNKGEKSPIQKQRERQLKELESIEDEDERRDRRKVGFIVDSLDY